MKIAIISDIHGNMEALEAVIDDINKQNADKIFILGDLAMAGPEPARTVDYIMELVKNKDVTIIQGNTDEMIAKYAGKPHDPYLPPNEIMAEALKYAQKVLNKEQIDYLAGLPEKLSFKIGELHILLVHGSPRKNNEDILPAQDVEKIREIIKDTSEDLIFCGHTHLPAGYQIDKQTVVNTGSVGRPFTEAPQACYALMEYQDLSGKSFEISHRFIDYDAKSASKKLTALPFDGSEKLASMLIRAASRYPQ